MNRWKTIFRYLKWPVIILLQLIMILLILAILPIFPGLIEFLEAHPIPMVIIVGAVFAFGSFQIGWLTVHLGWLSKDQDILTRLAAALLGSYLPLILGVLSFPALESGNPFYYVAIFTSVTAFHLPEWVNAIQN